MRLFSEALYIIASFDAIVAEKRQGPFGMEIHSHAKWTGPLWAFRDPGRGETTSGML